MRIPRGISTYEYPGDLWECISGTHHVQAKRWSNYPVHVQDRLWLSQFRMLEHTFDELLALVAHALPNPNCHAYSYRKHSKYKRLMLVVNYLAHCPPSRQFGMTWNVPHNSFTGLIFKPTIHALYHLLFLDKQTRLVNYPKDAEGIAEIVDGFQRMHGLPGCAGAIDGSLLPCKKPTQKHVGLDRDSFYGYKGGIAHLLLGIVDCNNMFRFASVGNPASLGDGGLYMKTNVKKSIDDGLLNVLDIELTVNGQVRTIKPFLVGDKAFPLGRHMLKNYTPTPALNTPESKFNRGATNCRRHSELAFGWFKGRWCFMKRNCFWNDARTVKEATGVCCALHNFLVERSVAYDEELNAAHDRDGPDAPLAPQQIGFDSRNVGMAVRKLITDHLSGN
jgi:DDE superfamily endonuclease